MPSDDVSFSLIHFFKCMYFYFVEGEAANLEEAIKQVNCELQAENGRLHALNTSLHEKTHAIALKLKEMQEQLTAKETEAAELQNRVDDLDYELQKRRHRADSLESVSSPPLLVQLADDLLLLGFNGFHWVFTPSFRAFTKLYRVLVGLTKSY